MPFTAHSVAMLGVIVAVSLVLVLTSCTPTRRQPTAATPTAAPVVLATPAPTALPPTAVPPPPTAVPPPPTPIAPPSPEAASTTPSAPARLYVSNTGGQGLTMRRAPGGEPMGTLPDGTALTPTGELEEAAGRRWSKVRDAQGREGWVAPDFLTAEAPAPPASRAAIASPVAERAATAAVTASPTWPVPLIPTATLRPTGEERPTVRPSPTIGAQTRSAPTSPTAAASKPEASGDCHPSYPDFCIPPPPPDLNCSSAEIAGRKNFRITGPDVHRLDQGDRPGIACER